MLDRIKGVFFQNMLMTIRNMYAVQDVFLWSTLDLLIWGVTSVFISKISGNNQSIVLALLAGTIFWTIIWRTQQDISLTALRDVWDKNLINIFTSPITKWEFAVSLLIQSFIKGVLILLWMTGLSIILYKFNILVIGPTLLIFIGLLFVYGWAVGYLVLGLILRFGSKIDTLTWSFLAVLQPFMGVFYPTSILPSWIQKFALIFPPTYVFDNIRSYLINRSLNIDGLITAGLLNIVWLIICVWFYSFEFEQARKAGTLAKTE